MLLFGFRFQLSIPRCPVHKPDSAGYHQDGKKILPFQFFVKQQGGENNAQHRNQCVVNRYFTDRVPGKQFIINSKTNCRNQNQDE